MNESRSLLDACGRPACSPAPFLTRRAQLVWLLLYFAVGYFFVNAWMRPFDLSWTAALALFTPFYAAVVLGGLHACGRRPARESRLWLAALLTAGASLSLPWAFTILGGLQFAGLLVLAAYWTLSAGGRLGAGGRTSQWAPIDLFYALVILPFGNFGRHAAGLWQTLRQAAAGRRGTRRAVGLLCGAGLSGLLLWMVLPALCAADPQFERTFLWLVQAFPRLDTASAWSILLSLPVTAYLYGLFFGAASGRRALSDKRPFCAAAALFQKLPSFSLLLPAGLLSAVYLLFLALQADTLLSGFLGVLPCGFSYAEYARQGFFELCRTAAVTGAFLVFFWYAGRRCVERRLRLCSTLLCGLTLLLCAAAFSKLALYVAVYGMTVKRLLAGAALVWLFFCFAALLVKLWLRRMRFSLPRAAVFLGTALFLALAVLPPCWFGLAA